MSNDDKDSGCFLIGIGLMCVALLIGVDRAHEKLDTLLERTTVAPIETRVEVE